MRTKPIGKGTKRLRIMNIENIQEWMDMPLGSQVDFRINRYITRVPGGWVLTNTEHTRNVTSVFVPEPKKEAEKDLIQKVREQGYMTGNDLNAFRKREGWAGRRADDQIITMPCSIGYVTPEQAKIIENQPQTPL